MPLKLYNTLSKGEQEFVPLKKGRVSMYTCGPTVYGRPHIGNYSSFLMADLLRRWLEVSGLRVTHVKNITDVGHLVADRDEGEDKVERQAMEEKQDSTKGAAVPGRGATKDDVYAIVKKYTDQYLEDEKALSMLEPEHRPRASKFVPQMIGIIETLVKKGHAYETEDGVYFSVQTFPDYGKLSGNTLDKLNAGARIKVDEQKKHPADFALWKKCVGQNANHILRWPSPWGEGFPGWHIECSAMSSALLGEQIDIHTGGEDNIFPHHESEIAQSECSSEHHPFVRIWLHKRRIDLAGEKMSKSLGNLITLPNILKKGYSGQDLRYYLLSVHYRTNLKFSWKGMDDARKARLKVTEWTKYVHKLSVLIQSSDVNPNWETDDNPLRAIHQNFITAMNSDLNTSGALASIFDAVNLTNRISGVFPDPLVLSLFKFVELVKATFGCFELEEEQAIPSHVHKLIDERTLAREKKDFKESDRLREEIKKLGYEVRDEEKEQKVKKL